MKPNTVEYRRRGISTNLSKKYDEVCRVKVYHNDRKNGDIHEKVVLTYDKKYIKPKKPWPGIIPWLKNTITETLANIGWIVCGILFLALGAVRHIWGKMIVPFGKYLVKSCKYWNSRFWDDKDLSEFKIIVIALILIYSMFLP